jgi:dTDP-4-amino-4,6-dideoxygalactose transaminase
MLIETSGELKAPKGVAEPAAATVRFLDLSIKGAAERAELLGAIERVLEHGRLVLGPEVQQFERRVAELCGRRFGIGCGSGTDALILGIKALGIGSGDEVITTPLSLLATGSAVILNGATPVLGDIDETLNLDPTTIEKLITPRTKAILPVHFTGRLARMDEILEIARRHGLKVIEDGSQSFGASFEGRPTGAFGDIACISLNAMKILGGIGDAGIVVTDDSRVAERIDALRHSGVIDRDYCHHLSHNCRLDTVQAAVLLKRLDHYPEVIERRRDIAARYDRAFAGVVATPPHLPGYRDVYYTYTLRTSRRDPLRDYLTSRGIETKIQHPILMNDQPAFQGHIRGHSPRAAELVLQILCIPAHEKLTDDEQTYVIDAVCQFFGANG